MKMKNVASGKIYTIAQIFRDETRYFRVLYFDPEAGSWKTESIYFFVPVETYLKLRKEEYNGY